MKKEAVFQDCYGRVQGGVIEARFPFICRLAVVKNHLCALSISDGLVSGDGYESNESNIRPAFEAEKPKNDAGPVVFRKGTRIPEINTRVQPMAQYESNVII